MDLGIVQRHGERMSGEEDHDEVGMNVGPKRNDIVGEVWDYSRTIFGSREDARLSRHIK